MSSGNINELVTQLRSRYPGGGYYSVYESGFSGYSTHRALERQGIKNIIVKGVAVDYIYVAAFQTDLYFAY